MPELWCTGDWVWQDRVCRRAREIAAKFKDKNAYEIPAKSSRRKELAASKVHYLALKLANIAQVYTQHAYMRPYGVSTMLLLG